MEVLIKKAQENDVNAKIVLAIILQNKYFNFKVASMFYSNVINMTESSFGYLGNGEIFMIKGEHSKALRAFEKSLSLGNPIASLYLAEMYYFSINKHKSEELTPKNFEIAGIWFQVEEMLENNQSLTRIETLMRENSFQKYPNKFKNYVIDYLAKTQGTISRKILEDVFSTFYFQFDSTEDYLTALYHLKKKNYQEAHEILTRLSHQNKHIKSTLLLSKLYKDGVGVQKDILKGYDYYFNLHDLFIQTEDMKELEFIYDIELSKQTRSNYQKVNKIFRNQKEEENMITDQFSKLYLINKTDKELMKEEHVPIQKIIKEKIEAQGLLDTPQNRYEKLGFRNPTLDELFENSEKIRKIILDEYHVSRKVKKVIGANQEKPIVPETKMKIGNEKEMQKPVENKITYKVPKDTLNYIELGEMYFKGEGVQKDQEKAIRLFEKALQLGNKNSLNNLGNLFLLDKPNIEKAKYYFQIGTFMENPESYHCLGELYLYHLKDFKSARQNFTKAAKFGYSKSINKLGEMFLKGIGTEKNKEYAMEHFKNAAELNNDSSLNYLGEIYIGGVRVYQNYEKAKEYFLQAIELGNSDAMNNLGEIYLLGVSKDGKNLDLAAKYFEMAAALGNSKSLHYLGEMSFYGEKFEKNYHKSIEYFEYASDLGNINSMYYLGDIYYHGLGIEKNYEMAKVYFEKSAEGGNQFSINRLGEIYLKGLGVEKDYKKAREYFEKAIEYDEIFAIMNLAEMYYFGLGVEKDHAKMNDILSKFLQIDKRIYYFMMGKFKYLSQDYSNSFLDLDNSFSNGYNESSYFLSFMYLFGIGIPQNFEKAKELFEIGMGSSDEIEIEKWSDIPLPFDKVDEKILNKMESILKFKHEKLNILKKSLFHSKLKYIQKLFK